MNQMNLSSLAYLIIALRVTVVRKIFSVKLVEFATNARPIWYARSYDEASQLHISHSGPKSKVELLSGEAVHGAHGDNRELEVTHPDCLVVVFF